MNDQEPRVLYVLKSASRSGVPVLLLSYLRHVYNDLKVKPLILIERGGGELLSDFKEVALCITVINKRNPICMILYFFLRGTYLNFFSRFILLLYRPNAIFLSEVNISKPIVSAMHKKPVISWCHMLPTSLLYYNKSGDVSYALSSSAMVICCAQSVSAGVLSSFPSLDAKRLRVIPEFIDIDSILHPPSQTSCMVKESISSLKHYTKIICLCGPATARKGFDLLLPLVDSFCKLYTESSFLFLWIGADTSSPDVHQHNQSARLLGLDRYIQVLGPTANAISYIQQSSVFCLLSREDPMPLVTLEASLVGVPVCCFDKSGDIPLHFRSTSLKRACLSAPMEDVDGMARNIKLLFNSPDLSHAIADAASNIVRSYNSLLNSDTIYSEIKRCIASAD